MGNIYMCVCVCLIFMAHKTLIVRSLTWIAYSMLNFIFFCTSSRIVVISQVFNLADLTDIIWPEEKKKKKNLRHFLGNLGCGLRKKAETINTDNSRFIWSWSFSISTLKWKKKTNKYISISSSTFSIFVCLGLFFSLLRILCSSYMYLFMVIWLIQFICFGSII